MSNFKQGRHWTIILGTIILLVLFLLPARLSRGCGPVEQRFEGYSFLNPNIIDAEAKAAPFFLDFEQIYRAFGGQERVQIEDNIAEWRERFCDLPRAQDIYEIVYQASLNTMERIRQAALSKSIGLDPVLAGNTFARHLVQERCIEVIDYLIFAKRCEPHVTLNADPWEDVPRDRTAMEGLIESGWKAFYQTESHYVRLRYAYQVLRLAHYSGQYQRTLDLYDRMMPMIDNDPSLIEFWIEGHRAGALMGLGRNVEAAYLYSRIFDQCLSKRESAYRSFRIKTDEEWEQCLLLCRDDQERAALYAMRASSEDSKAVEDMERIYDLDPQSDYLEVLLVEEIRKLEQNLLGLGFNDHALENRQYYDIPKPWAGDYVIAMQAFVRRVTREARTARPALWKIAEGYLELLAGEYYYAARTFSDARQLLGKKQEKLAAQLEAFELALKISAWQQLTDSVEVEAARIMRRDPVYEQYPDFRDFLRDKMASLYQAASHPGLAFMCHYPLKAMAPNPQPELIDDLLLLCRQEERNRFEKALVEPSEGNTIESDLLDMRAVLQLSSFQPEAALETLKEMEPEWDNYGLFNPFVQVRPIYRDCVHCPLPSNVPVYNRRDMIQRLLDLEYRAKSEPAVSDSLYYELGLAWYNLTYFGHAWDAMDYFRSGASLEKWNLQDGGNVIDHYYYPFGNRENFDCSRALYFFERARLLSENPELIMKAAFMAAKCERNNFYANRVQGAVRNYDHFRLLKENYLETEFCQRLIKECKTFEAYVLNGP